MKKTAIIILILTSYGSMAQQEPLLAQYHFNQMPINPAYTGVNNMTSFDLQYRQQWAGLDGSPRTAQFSGQTSLNRNSLGLGFQLMQDKVGIITNTNLGLASSYKVYIEDGSSISFGLQASWNGLNYNYEELTLDDQTDEDFAVADNSLSKINFGTGIFLNSNIFYLGVSIPRILKEIGVTGERLTRHYYFTGGVILDLTQSLKLKPYTILRYVEGGAYSYDLGANVFLANIFWVGAFARDFRDYGISIYLNTIRGIRIGYSGELISEEIASTLSTHEISLGLDMVLFKDQEVRRRDF